MLFNKKLVSIIMLLLSILITLAISEIPMIMSFVHQSKSQNPDSIKHIILDHLP
jgi:hypothetical protein